MFNLGISMNINQEYYAVIFLLTVGKIIVGEVNSQLTSLQGISHADLSAKS